MIHQVAIKASDITPPTARTLTYNGNNQDLVVAGKCPYGVLEYTMDGRANTSTTENWTAYNGNNWSTLNGSNNTGWSKTIPQGKYAGSYKIYWRVDADQNHYDYTNHPNSGNIDKVDVTIQRAPQKITLDSTSVTFCYHNINRGFNVTSRYENATFKPLTITGPVSANQNDTNVTVYSSDSYGMGTGKVTVNTAQTANYKAGSVTFTAHIVDHNWVETNVNSSNASQWPGCNNSGATHSRCWPWPDCTHTGLRHEICNYGCQAKQNVTISANPHNSVYGGTRDCHTKCSKCGGTLTGYSSHRFSSTVIKAATCTTAGTTRYTCACGYSYTRSGTPAAKGHTFESALHFYTGNTHYRRSSCCGYINVGGHTMTSSRSGCCYYHRYCVGGDWGRCYDGNSSGGTQAHYHKATTTRTRVKIGKQWKWKTTTTCHCGNATKTSYS